MPKTTQIAATDEPGSVTRLLLQARQGHLDALNELLQRLRRDFARQMNAGLNWLQQADREIVSAQAQVVISRRIREEAFKSPENRDAFFRWIWGVNNNCRREHQRGKRAQKRRDDLGVPLSEYELSDPGDSPETTVWQKDFIEYITKRVDEHAQHSPDGAMLVRMFAMLKEGRTGAGIQRDLQLTRSKYERMLDLIRSLAKDGGDQ